MNKPNNIKNGSNQLEIDFNKPITNSSQKSYKPTSNPKIIQLNNRSNIYKNILNRYK